jgi:Zn2+/Cd2+-exporting ATPase
VSKSAGSQVSSGTQNLWGSLRIECLRPARQSALQRVIDLIQQARHLRAPSQRLTDRFGPPYTYAILAVTVLMFFVWWLGFGVSPFIHQSGGDRTVYSAFYRAMTLLVVASPCALVLSIPSAILAAIASGARQGILYRGGAAIERLAGVKVVALDKTGTLTTGEMEVISVESFPPGQESEVARLAFSLEQNVSHPIAGALCRYARDMQLSPLPVEGFRNLAGQGVEGQVGGDVCFLGKRDLLSRGPLAEWAEQIPDTPEGLSEVWFVHRELLGRFLLEDRLRAESARVLLALHESGIHTAMLTGDRSSAARLMGEKLAVGSVHSGLSPEDKVAVLQKLRHSYGVVAMVGDGINDAPSLAAADIAVAMGAHGSDAALEQSDVVLMQDKIENFLAAFQLSRRARRVIQQNIFISLATILIMVAAAIFGIVPITVGVLAHEGSTVLVCLNSMRLLRVIRPLPRPSEDGESASGPPR